MAKKSSRAAIVEEPELEASDDQVDSGGDGERISKAEAARRTLAEGIDVPRKASLYIKDKYGLDITAQQFSAEKSRLKHRAGGHIPQAGPHPSSRFATYTTPVNGTSASDPGVLEALEAIKPLVESLGADKVKRMVDLLG